MPTREWISTYDPLYIQNQIIITPSVHFIDRLRSICFILKTDERKAFASTSISVPSDIYATRRKGL